VTESLISRLETASELGKSVTFVGDGAPDEVPWGRFHEDARRTAAALQARGIGPGKQVAVIGPTSRPLVTAVAATWLAGAAVIMLPMPARAMSADEFRSQTLARIRNGEAALTLCEADMVETLTDAEGPGAITLTDLESEARAQPAGAYIRPADDPDALAILQFTSGSTGDPRGVEIPHRCVLDNNDALEERMPVDIDSDVAVSWLPLYHDLGLVYVLTYIMARGVNLVIAPTTAFAAAPGRWMEWMSDFGGTWTIGPNFSLGIAARLLPHGKAVDLSRCRSLGSGAEPANPRVMDAMATVGAEHGLDPLHVYAAYGMAEATVAITVPASGVGYSSDVIDGEDLEKELRAVPVGHDHPRARRMIPCGHPLRGMEVRIADPQNGNVLGPRDVGEIEARGPSVVPGYFKNPEATAATFRADGWLRTGDLGYLVGDDLVICGRLKDVLNVGGHNVFPQDLERAAEEVEGVRRGNVIAFGTNDFGGRESVVIVAEVKTEDLGRVRDGIAGAVRATMGIRVDDVVLLRPGTLPKTSSGKVRRSICRARYTTSELAPL
jgi:fatty-acyl-CoA synthase